jgi:hypothetical protein
MSSKKQHSENGDAARSGLGIDRRAFLGGSAALGAAAFAFRPTQALAAEGSSGPVMSGASSFEPLQINSPMARWKSPQPLDFVEAAPQRYSFPNWQSGTDDSVCFNMTIPSCFASGDVAGGDAVMV